VKPDDTYELTRRWVRDELSEEETQILLQNPSSVRRALVQLKMDVERQLARGRGLALKDRLRLQKTDPEGAEVRQNRWAIDRSLTIQFSRRLEIHLAQVNELCGRYERIPTRELLEETRKAAETVTQAAKELRIILDEETEPIDEVRNRVLAGV
jgi:hypothetical protein